MNKILSTITFVLLTSALFAQEPAAERGPISVDKVGTWVPAWDNQDFGAMLTTERQPHLNPNQETIKIYKEEINARKQAAKDSLPHTMNLESQYKTTAASNPAFTKGFTTSTTQGTPSDNTVGINSQGQILVAVNSRLKVYSSSGSDLTGDINLSSFFSNPRNGSLLSNRVCDPKVLYDPRAKRFIVMAQTCDGNSSTSQVLVAFSKTENPAGAWNFYQFTGNPSNFVSGNSWFDYPKIGVNDHDLFVTGNLFDNNKNPKQSVIYHLDKGIGYNGGTFGNNDAAIFYNISGSPFTLVPATVGRNMSMGNKMYFVCTRIGLGTSSSEIRLYEIDGTVQSFPTLNRTNLFVSSYSQPADAIQPSTSVRLDVSDYRGMDAIWVNGTIHFVTHILGPNDYDQIMYDRIYKNGTAWAIDDYVISANNVDLAYPSICSMGWNNNDQSVAILVNFASPSHYPSIGVVYVNDDLQLSDIMIVKEGDRAVTVYPEDGVTRWGDYTGLCPEYSNPHPTAWGFGMYGTVSSSVWRNYVTNIINTQYPNAVANVSSEAETVEIYPNPIEDNWNIKFETEEMGVFSVNIYDVTGALVKNLYNQELVRGKHNFSFDKGALGTGTYLVKLSLDGKDIATEKILVK